MSKDFLRFIIAICAIISVSIMIRAVDIYEQSQLTDSQKVELAQAKKQKLVEEAYAKSERERIYKKQAEQRKILITQSFFDIKPEKRLSWIFGYFEANPYMLILSFLGLLAPVLLTLRARF